MRIVRYTFGEEHIRTHLAGQTRPSRVPQVGLAIHFAGKQTVLIHRRYARELMVAARGCQAVYLYFWDKIERAGAGLIAAPYRYGSRGSH